MMTRTPRLSPQPRHPERSLRGRDLPRPMMLAWAILFCLGLQGCGLWPWPSTPERWYPTYSHYRATQPNIVVFIHGYGGSEDTFTFLPYLVARFPGRTIMYFTYDTGALRSDLDSFSVIGSQLRAFLHTNIFSRDPQQEVSVICHSTGCPIVRQYIADNPFDHRIAKLLTVAGAHYGAYYAESTSKLKALLPLLQGDKQIRELKYGSFTLFYLQQRWHHLFQKTLLVDKAKNAKEPWKDAKEPWLEGTPRRDFVDVVSPEVDKRYGLPVGDQPPKDAVEQWLHERVTEEPHLTSLPDSLRNKVNKTGLPKENDHAKAMWDLSFNGMMSRDEHDQLRTLFIEPENRLAVDRLFRRSRPLNLPEMAAIVGTDGWRSSGSGKFSDGVVRVESAIPDCRFLAQAPKGFWDLAAKKQEDTALGKFTPDQVSKLQASDHDAKEVPTADAFPSHECKDKLIVFLPCSHTTLFSEGRCRQVILDVAEYLFFDPYGEHTLSRRTDSEDHYDAAAPQDKLSAYLRNLDVGALWIRVRHGGFVDDTEVRGPKEWAKTLDPLKVEPPVNRGRTWFLGLYESDFWDAQRRSDSGPETVFYYKYVIASQDITIRLSLCLESGKACDPIRIRTPLHENEMKEMVVSVPAGQTNMISCDSYSNLSTPLSTKPELEKLSDKLRHKVQYKDKEFTFNGFMSDKDLNDLKGAVSAEEDQQAIDGLFHRFRQELFCENVTAQEIPSTYLNAGEAR